jgi:hypothetical protein
VGPAHSPVDLPPGLEVELVSHRGFKLTAAASAAALMAFTLAAGPPALAGQRTEPQARGTAATAAAGGPRQVMLITGDVVRLSSTAGGRQTASVIKAQHHGSGAQFQMYTLGRDLYVVPESAVPYLGTTLSPALFDVTQLAQQENGRLALAVQLGLRSASGRVAVPGITVTHRSGLTATGRLTEASARRFGVALARQAERDHASATHTTGLFASLARIAPPQAVTARPARTAGTAGTASTGRRGRPNFQMYTLTLHGIDAAGKKDTGDLVLVYNVDDLEKYAGEADFVNGQTKISVPVGHYAAVCFFYNFTTGAVSGVTMPQFTVSADTSVTVDARTATSPVSVTTPRPTSPVINEVGVGRADRTGANGSYAFLGSGQTSFSVTPVTNRVSVGQLYYYVYSRLFSPPGAKMPYSYDVEFPSNGAIPVNEHYAALPSGLATVRSSYPADQSGTPALETRFGALPWQSVLFGDDVSITTPMQRTEYYSALPDLSWEGVYYSVFSSSPFELLGELDSAWTSYQPGTSSSVTWGGQPQTPRLLQTPLFVNQTFCPACVEGSTLNLLAFPYSDNSPDHRGYPDGTVSGLTEAQSYDVYADGVPVTKGTGFLEKKVTLPAGAKDLAIDYDTTRSAADLTLSTSVDTRWTVRTAAPRGTLPSGWYCDFSLHTKCGVLPLMYANYDLPVNSLGQLPSGSATAGVYMSHLAGATDVAVSSLTASVSFDGGTSWHKASVTPEGNGQYALAFTVPAAAQTDGFGALRLSATDAYGGALSQTIQHAFAVAAS